MTTAREGSTPSSFAAIKNVSGAGFPARCSASIVLPSTRMSKNASNFAALNTAVQFWLEVTTAILNPRWRS